MLCSPTVNSALVVQCRDKMGLLPGRRCPPLLSPSGAIMAAFYNFSVSSFVLRLPGICETVSNSSSPPVFINHQLHIRSHTDPY